jgi:cell division cycle protein 20 (cofactor of APC complex)
VASGGNEGKVNIWDIRNKNTFFSYHLHRGAVKALEWCPWKIDLLASGGGAKDHQIILWNSHDRSV